MSNKWVKVDSEGEEIDEESLEEEENLEEGEEQEEPEEKEDFEEEEDEEQSNSDSEILMYQDKIEEDNDNDAEKYKNYTPSEEDKKNFSQLLPQIKNQIDELISKLTAISQNLDSPQIETKFGISYYEAKQNLFLMYLTQLLYYFELKLTSDSSINESPLIKSMMEIKSILERSKIIDMKLKPQIEKLISIAENKTEEETNYKPRLIDNEEEEEEEEDEEVKEKEKEKIKYQVKKNMIEFFETKDEKNYRRRQIEKDKEQIKNSEHIRMLREEFSDKPHVEGGDTSNVDKYLKALRKYNEEHFQSIKPSKKDLKILRRKDRKEDDLQYFDKEMKQMSNVLFHDNEDKEERALEKNMFIQKKRELKKMNNSKSAFGKKQGKKPKRK